MGILKIVFRTLIILVAAGLICAGIYLWVNNSGSSLALGGEHAEFDGQRTFTSDGTRPQFEGRGFPGNGTRLGHMGSNREGGFANGAGLQRGLIDLAMKLGMVALITAAIALLGWIIRLAQRKLKPKTVES